MSPKIVFDLMREDDIKHDPWGTCMMWHFALCDVMTEWAPPYPQAEWGYRQAMGGVDSDSMQYKDLTGMMESGELDSNDLLYIGKVLHRYENILEKKGRSY